jgi:hypothetical protein
MPFGFKNAGATYQFTMDPRLHNQIGRNFHAYVNDIIVMSLKGNNLIRDLEETFKNLQTYKIMLNPTKCIFGVPAGKLLGFIVLQRDIEVYPEKTKATLNISSPTFLQGLTGCIAAVSRFVIRFGEKAIPLYRLFKKVDKFVWNEVADSALQELNKVISSAPIHVAP